MTETLDRASLPIGQYLTLGELCTCTHTYQQYHQSIDPFPQSLESLEALTTLCTHLIDPIIQHFGKAQFELTYRFCSVDLKRFLAQTNPATGRKNGRVDPSLDRSPQ